jgi:hypothetical protein
LISWCWVIDEQYTTDSMLLLAFVSVLLTLLLSYKTVLSLPLLDDLEIVWMTGSGSP